MPRSWQSGERDEDLHFTHTESVLCLRGVGTSSERSLHKGEAGLELPILVGPSVLLQ